MRRFEIGEYKLRYKRCVFNLIVHKFCSRYVTTISLKGRRIAQIDTLDPIRESLVKKAIDAQTKSSN